MEVVPAHPEIPAPEVPAPEIPDADSPTFEVSAEPSPPPTNLFVSNLTFKVTSEDLREIFDKVGTVVTCEVQTHHEGGSKGYALVQFSTEEEAQRAIDELTNHELEGRPMNIRHDLSTEDRPGTKHQVTRRLRPVSGQHRAPAYGRQLFVGNLNFRTSWQDLKDEFRTIGEVVRAEVFTSVASNGYRRSKGCGIVVMSSDEDAQKAIADLNGREVHKRNIVVRLDMPPEDRPRYVAPAETSEGAE